MAPREEIFNFRSMCCQNYYALHCYDQIISVSFRKQGGGGERGEPGRESRRSEEEV